MINAPPIGILKGKNWGKTRCVFSHNNTEIWEIEVDKGGFCSEHHHNAKWNRFVISKGKLKVTVFTDDSQDDTIIGPGDYTDVPPNQWHMFEAIEDVEGIEVYWTELDPVDIVRRNQGGMRNAR